MCWDTSCCPASQGRALCLLFRRNKKDPVLELGPGSQAVHAWEAIVLMKIPQRRLLGSPLNAAEAPEINGKETLLAGSAEELHSRSEIGRSI